METYQISHGLQVVCSCREKRVKEITFEGKEIPDEALFKLGLQGFHFKNIEDFFGITEEEVTGTAPYKVLSTNAMDILDEYLSRKELVKCPEDPRWVMEDCSSDL